ncbi:MAG: KpsF/GutQ family sugar-phosphate isomerase [Cryomorphaceae bacterium]|nr:KpsF/GutQ family sugar-phosphate isomerase [Cryomorphaceae bacterium]MDG1889488.1 KpsF/GutQ family sugar-phosphate isomerase [Flavobacteriaceae bacterium]MBT3503406.1 KpsF/GutQ family sugar-phosphate isomerase [Cryomorphaceae bacterium]MBT3688644.1 KpsF/GutQ family sugar-phosphate isomerase [Cryomorphaceae bacterium]MBT4222251.1 KpsF/GutQ family sugar-phosphate isomerase [Cryomorphaceae bacterium]
MTNQQIIKNIALDTIHLESKSVSDLSSIIDSNFCNIIDLLKECQGKIVLTGIGKSAIIGMKISATLNSTGSKSIFLHLGDALHGDMGVIGREDVVICVSKSGESDEIISLSNHLTKNKILLIGISCVKNSSLDKLSTMFLHTKINREACHNNLAPTTSSTCHLAIGDAIAMTLQKIKGFTPNDFSKYHPSGSLGKKLSLSLKNLIDETRKPIVEKSSSFLKVIDEISSNMYGATAVLEENTIIGIITDGDIRRVIEKKQNIENISALDFMNNSPKIMNQSTLAIEALKHMKENSISQVLIANDNNKYLGIVHILDIIKQGISYE